jgi:hypothetical protein
MTPHFSAFEVFKDGEGDFSHNFPVNMSSILDGK